MKFILKHTKALFAVLLTLVILIGTIVLAVVANRKELPEPLTAAAEKRDIMQTVGAVGEIRCASEETVLFMTPYPVETVAVRNGDTVSKGTLLFRCDAKALEEDIAECERLLQKLESAEALSRQNSAERNQHINSLLQLAVNQADEQYQNALATLADAKTALDHGRAEYEAFLAESSDSDDPAAAVRAQMMKNQCERYETIWAEAESNVEIWSAQKTEAEHTLREAADSEQYQTELQRFAVSAAETYRIQLEKLYAMRSKTEVNAPCSGVVTNLFCVSGESGRQYTPAVQIGCTDAFEAVLTVSAETRAKLRIGMQVWLTSSTAPEQSADAVITGMRLNAQNEYEIIAAVDQLANETLRSGAACSGRMILERAEQALCVPYDAVCTDDSGEYVWRMESGIPVKQPVKTGLHCGYYTEIVDDGALQVGDEVLLNPAEYLGENAL